MCGIAGYRRLRSAGHGPNVLLKMLSSVAHRGPDDEGLVLVDLERRAAHDYVTPNSAAGVTGRPAGEGADVGHDVGLGHRRFSIVDLSTGGHQPFWSSERDVCVSFNGEIYNYAEVRAELAAAGREFRTNSDTEVLVEAYLHWGTDCFRRLNGMWALSLVDLRTRRVLLARDRIGKIPLYISRTSESVTWCSEIKGLLVAWPNSTFPVDERSLVDFIETGRRDLQHRTFYRGIECLPCASFAWVAPDGAMKVERYWAIPEHRLNERDLSPEEAGAMLRTTLSDSVRLRLRADVPVGVELSGGMDSSTLVALAAEQCPYVDAFTVSFPGTPHDEEPFARAVADSLPGRVAHHVLLPEHDDFFDRANEYVALMGEPFHSPVLLTNHSIWQRMREHGIRVCINGGGGDELLAGYGGEYFALYLRHTLRRGRSARFVREFLLYTEHREGSTIKEYLRTVYQLLPPAMRLYRNRARDIPPEIEPFRAPHEIRASPGASRDLEARLIADATEQKMRYWLASDNQSCMGVPIELRLPFLDHRVVELAFQLPVSYLIRDGWLKWILRTAMRGRLPEEILWRRHKMGFPFPHQEWLARVRERFLSIVTPLDCPHIDTGRLARHYVEIASRDPERLWRYMSVALWWKRCILGEPLA